MNFNKTTNKLIARLAHRLKWINLYIKIVISLYKVRGCDSCYSSPVFTAYHTSFLKELGNKGNKQTIALYKAYHRIASCLALGAPFEPVARRRTLPGTTIPKDLKPLVKLLTGSVLDKRIGMTIVNIYKILYLSPDQDLSPITDKGPDISSPLSNFSQFLRLQDGPLLTPFTFPEKRDLPNIMYLTGKKGPNGPSMTTFWKDGLAIISDPLLYSNLTSLLDITNPHFADGLRMVFNTLPFEMDDYKGPNYFHSRLSQISEGGGKTRNIAIVDWWSQNALKPIHNEVMRRLRSIKQDATYSQEDGFSSAKERAVKLGVCYSFDLTSATDRFPLSFQTVVSKQLFGEEAGRLWSEVIANREFKHPVKQETVRWGIGQPLGALSSWGLFALTHHLFIKWCAGSLSFDKYMILGDDVLIFDKITADTYLARLKEIGVNINLNKSYVSNKPDHVFGEFAKRIFLNNDELTGLPLDLVEETRKSVYLIPEFLRFLERRWGTVFPGRELYAPGFFSYLSVKGKRLLTVILGFQQFLGATEASKALGGYPWCCLNGDTTALYRSIVDRYLTKYNDKVSDAFAWIEDIHEIIFADILPMVKDQRGDHVSRVVLGWFEKKMYDPINLYLVKTSDTYSKTEEELQQTLDKLSRKIIDYAPDLAMASFRMNKRTQTAMNHGRIVLEIYYELLNKQKVTLTNVSPSSTNVNDMEDMFDSSDFMHS